MTGITLHAPPRWRVIAVEQLRAVGLHLRVVGAVFLVSLAVYGGTAILYARHVHEVNVTSVRHVTVWFGYSPDVSILMVFMALILPVAMWIEEGPHRRAYHWSMPSDRPTHALTRTLAGWVWLIGATAVWLSLILAIHATTQHIVGLTPPAGMRYGGWTLLVPFTAVTIAYLLSSAAAIGARTPLLWIVAPPAVYVFACFILNLLGYRDAAQALMTLFTGRYGAAAALAGYIQIVDVSTPAGVPSPQRWLGAAALWGGAAATLVFMVSRRRNEEG